MEMAVRFFNKANVLSDIIINFIGPKNIQYDTEKLLSYLEKEKFFLN